MLLKRRPTVRLSRILSLLMFTLASLSLDIRPALAVGSPLSLPSLTEFAQLVQNGQKDQLRGVYVDQVLALPIVQQPKDQATFVSSQEGEATQFGLAAEYGTVGLLAHNHKAGAFFLQLKPGQEVRLIFGDGYVETFTIKRVLKFQALDPTNPYSSFKNLDKDETLTAAQLFNQVYAGHYHLTFQTCIAANGKQSWGRLFVIAEPREKSQAAH